MLPCTHTMSTESWRYDWGNGHARGVDLIRVHDEKISEKYSYVKW